MIIAMELDRNVDLSLFSGYLAQIGLRHRISETGDKQVVRVYERADVERVRELYGKLARGEVQFERHEVPKSERRPQTPSFLLQMRQAPLTVALVLITVAFYPVTSGINQGHFSALLRLMTFVDFGEAGGYLYFAHLSDTIASGQYWRFLSPMFLHFSIMHIVFNLLWVWEVGKRIERVNGALVLLVVVLVSSLSSNFLQYAISGPALFGGMSGVVFGLLGYCFVWSKLVPSRDVGLPIGIYIFMVAYLALGFLGVFDFIMPGKLANGAHLGGMAAGLVLGLIFSVAARQTKTS